MRVIPKGGKRFSVFAKPVSAGEAESERIVRRKD